MTRLLNKIITLERTPTLVSSEIHATYVVGRLRAKLLGVPIPTWLGVLLTTGSWDYVK